MSFGGDRSYTPYSYDDNTNSWETDSGAGSSGFNNPDPVQPMNEEETAEAAALGAKHLADRDVTQGRDVDVTKYSPTHKDSDTTKDNEEPVKGTLVQAVPETVTKDHEDNEPSWFSWRSYGLGFASGALVARALSYFLK